MKNPCLKCYVNKEVTDFEIRRQYCQFCRYRHMQNLALERSRMPQDERKESDEGTDKGNCNCGRAKNSGVCPHELERTKKLL